MTYYLIKIILTLRQDSAANHHAGVPAQIFIKCRKAWFDSGQANKGGDKLIEGEMNTG